MFTASQPGRHLRASKITSRSLRVQRRRKSRSAPASSTALATLNYWSLFKAHTGRSDVATPHINSSLKIKRDSCLFWRRRRREEGTVWTLTCGDWEFPRPLLDEPLSWVDLHLPAGAAARGGKKRRGQFSTSSSAFAQLHVGASSTARTGTENELK